MNILALKSSATSLRLMGDWSPTGCSASFNMRLYCHPAIISTHSLKVCASWGIAVVKKTAVPNPMVKITTEIQTPDSDDDLSCPRDKLSQIYKMLKMQAQS